MAEGDLISRIVGDPPAEAGAWPRPHLARWCDRLAGLVGIVLVCSLAAELCVVAAEIVLRFFFERSLLWSDEISRLFLSAIAFSGGALAYRAGQHTSVEFLTRKMTSRGRALAAAAVDATVLVTAASVGLVSWDFLSVSAMSSTPMLGINAAWLVLPLTVGMSLLVLFAVERLICAHAGAVAALALAGVGLVAAVIYVVSDRPDWAIGTDAALGPMLVVFVLAVLLGLPVAFAMLAGSASFLLLTGVAPMIAVAQNAQDGTGNFILLTLPFFIWAGLIMERGGISLRLVRFAMALVGHIRGGLLQVVVLTIFLVSGISGSKIADVVAVGSVLRRELKARGYAPEHGAAVLAASAAMSETIPPSIAMLVLGSVAPISIGTLFVAGVAPAALIAVLLMVLNYAIARRSDIPALPRESRAALLGAARGVVLPLVMPAIMVLGIRFGIATPTEVSSVAVLYGLVLAIAIYRSVDARTLYAIAAETCRLAGMVLFIIASAVCFGWTLTAADLPGKLASLLHAAGDSRLLFVVGSIALFVVVGSLLEGLPALIILGPLLLPISGQFGMDPVHYSMIMILAMGVGIFIPPIGIGFYVACAVADASLERTARVMLPFLLVLVAGILLVAFVPAVTFALPWLIQGR